MELRRNYFWGLRLGLLVPIAAVAINLFAGEWLGRLLEGPNITFILIPVCGFAGSLLTFRPVWAAALVGLPWAAAIYLVLSAVQLVIGCELFGAHYCI